MDGLRVDGDGPVRTLTIDRPACLNALTEHVATELAEQIEAFDADNTVRAVVLRGAGEHFGAGADVHMVAALCAEKNIETTTVVMRALHRLTKAIWYTDLPVVAAVSGVVYGGAFNLVLAADLVVACERSRFCQAFLLRGVVPDLGGAYFLPKLVGMQRAKELMYLAPEIDARRAHELGIVNEVYSTPEETFEGADRLAQLLADRPPFALAQTKRLLNGSTHLDLRTTLELEAGIQTTVLATQAAKEGFDTFIDRNRSVT